MVAYGGYLDNAMLYRIDENDLHETKLVGKQCEKTVNDIKHLIDLIYENDEKGINYNFFDIKGTVLMHGIAGVGKTTIAMNCMSYAINKYGVESYVLDVSDIIVSGLGESVKNMHDKLAEFEELREGILFIDEIDKLLISRNTVGELSEMKRLLIEFMGYVDKLTVEKRKVLIGCTNVYEQMDEALKRRFSINEEIQRPLNEEKNEFFSICLSKAGIHIPTLSLKRDFLDKFETMDSIKAYFRRNILDKSLDQMRTEIELEQDNNSNR